MRYLKKTMKLGIHYKRFPVVLEGYIDADWNTLSDDSKATDGYIFSIAGGAVSWKSKKQTIMAQSTMEYEMIALVTSSEEASWSRCLLSEIPLWEKHMPAVLIHCDSTAVIAKIENQFYNGKKRQIRRKHDTVTLQEISFLAATNVAGKNAKVLQKVFFAAKKLLLHVAGISAVAKSFARTINVAAITSVLQQQLMSLTKLVFLATINVAGITSDFLQQQLLSLS
ncbi:hypothetical protein QL285_088008 [Trifolium repens]|nr:hypothetical protein QL285_088008 [Trifolium repens]